MEFIRLFWTEMTPQWFYGDTRHLKLICSDIQLALDFKKRSTEYVFQTSNREQPTFVTSRLDKMFNPDYRRV